MANSGEAQLRAVSLWGAAAAVGAAAGPLMGGALVTVAGWQGLFWVDAVIGIVCILIAARQVSESRDPTRSRSIDYAGSILIALTLAPLVLALSKGSAWGWASAATIGCLALGIASGVGFVMVERRVAVPMLDLALLRNRVLVGSTMAILIGAGTINALMYLLSLYFQSPDTLGFTTLQAGLATLPATVGLVAIAAAVPRLTARLGGRQVVGLGFLLTSVGFAAIGFVDASWAYRAFFLPLVAVAVGHGALERPCLVGVHRLRVSEPGRLSLWGLEHGPVRGGGRGHGAGRHDLRRSHRRPHGQRRDPGRRARFGSLGRVLGHGRPELRRGGHGRRHGPSPSGARNHSRLGRCSRRCHLVDAPDQCHRTRHRQRVVPSSRQSVLSRPGDG